MSRHATFENFGMAFLTLFQVSTGDNWNGIMKVTRPSGKDLLLVGKEKFQCVVCSAELGLAKGGSTEHRSWVAR